MIFEQNLERKGSGGGGQTLSIIYEFGEGIKVKFYINLNINYDLNNISILSKSAFDMPDVLQEIPLAIVDQKICKKNMKSILPIREGMICAGGEKDKSVCYGDSGSSLFRLINEKFIQFGITSWGKPQCDSDGYQSVFTRVSYYSDWIRNKIDNN